MTLRGRGWEDPGGVIAARWGEYLPPARPSRDELLLYARILRDLSVPAASAAILGSTPELRDLLADLGHEYACMDVSAANFAALGALRQRNGAERLVAGDWAETVSGPWSVLVGDGALNMLPLAAWAVVLANWRRSLLPGGALVHRFYSWRADDVPDGSSRPGAAVERAVAEGRARGLSYYQAAAYEIYRQIVRVADWTVDFADFTKRVRQLHAAGAIPTEELEAHDFVFVQSASALRITIPPRPLIESLAAAAGFEVVEVVTAGDGLPFHADCPIYVLAAAPAREAPHDRPR
jgi:hypothetical protein